MVFRMGSYFYIAYKLIVFNNFRRENKFFQDKWKCTNGCIITCQSLRRVSSNFSINHIIIYLCYLTAPSPVTNVKRGKIAKNSISLSWQEPDRPNGIILEYEIKYFEKVGLGK